MEKRFLAECFWPGVTGKAHADASARAEASASTLRHEGHDIRFLGSELVPADEVVFYRFSAGSSGDVEQAGAVAGLTFDRIVEYVDPRHRHPTE